MQFFIHERTHDQLAATQVQMNLLLLMEAVSERLSKPRPHPALREVAAALGCASAILEVVRRDLNDST